MGEWVQVAVRFTMWENAQKPNVYTWLNAGAGTAYADDVNLYEAPDLSALEAALADAEEKLGQTDIYTAESLGVLQNKAEESRTYTGPLTPAKRQTESTGMWTVWSRRLGINSAEKYMLTLHRPFLLPRKSLRQTVEISLLQ